MPYRSIALGLLAAVVARVYPIGLFSASEKNLPIGRAAALLQINCPNSILAERPVSLHRHVQLSLRGILSQSGWTNKTRSSQRSMNVSSNWQDVLKPAYRGN